MRRLAALCVLLAAFALAAAPSSAAPSAVGAAPMASASAAGAAPTAAAAPAPAGLGRLFFTPEERAGLDRQRLTGVAAADGGAFMLNGISRNRMSGRATVWVNGIPWFDASHLTGVRPSRRDAAAATVAPGKGKPISLRVGDAGNFLSGEKQELLPPRSLTVHRPPQRGK